MRAKSPALDRFRIVAAVLVTAIHTSPLATYTADGDFFLTRVLARLAVPFFFLVTGYFLSRSEWSSLPRFLKKTGLLYLAAMLLYLPLNLYSRNLSGWENMVRGILFDGTFYHLWYFPAVLLGSLLSFLLSRRGPRFALTAAGLLYLIGLGGDSYYGLISSLPFGKACYDILLSVSAYTRNGVFFAPLFLLLGAYAKRRNPRLCLVGFLLSFAAMSVEAFLLRAAEAQRHDSMYLLLPFCSLFLFSLLLSRNSGQNRDARRFSAVFYVVHPWCIVLVRGAAEVLGLEAVLVRNSLGHFLAVLLLSAAVSLSAVFFLPRRPSETGRAWCEIDLRALRSNTFLLQRKAGAHSSLMAVIKADAYGHGAIPCARTLRRCGVRAFAVATLEEGIALRRAAVRGTILILGYTPPEEADLLVRWRLTQAVMDEPYARQLAAQGRRVIVHVAVDTGMHRIGIPVEEVAAFRRIYRLPHLRFTGIFSHLCTANGRSPEEKSFAQMQTNAFLQLVSVLRSCGCPVGDTHLLASAGILRFPPQPCSHVRAGLALFGAWETQEERDESCGLRPVLSLRARIVSVRRLETGERAGYGLAFEAMRPTVLATVSIGYADGLPRNLAARGGEVLLHGKRVPIVGRLCMDQLLIDATDAGETHGGEIVTLIGRDGEERISAEELAGRCGTITNELFSRLGSRLGRCILP